MGFLKSFFGTQAPAKTESALDAVTYLASLASNPNAIDPILENVRELTASRVPGQELSQKDQVVLAKVYQELETHLIKDEPLRQFTKENIRDKIKSKFPKHNEGESIFWENITAEQ